MLPMLPVGIIISPISPNLHLSILFIHRHSIFFLFHLSQAPLRTQQNPPFFLGKPFRPKKKRVNNVEDTRMILPDLSVGFLVSR